MMKNKKLNQGTNEYFPSHNFALHELHSEFCIMPEFIYHYFPFRKLCIKYKSSSHIKLSSQVSGFSFQESKTIICYYKKILLIPFVSIQCIT